MPPFRPNPVRPSQYLRLSQCSQTRPPVRIRPTLQTTRTFSSATLEHQRPSRQLRRLGIASTVIGGSLFLYYTHRTPHHLDAPPPSSTSPSNNPSAPILITKDTDDDLVPTGTSTIPFFPRTIHLPSSTTETATTATRTLPYGTGSTETSEEYQLLGLGIRKVSFLGIQVYVVGLYIARSDLPKLQESLVRAYFTSNASGDSIISSATTLVENEKSELRELLLGGAGDKGGRGEKLWDEVLREAKVKSILRIVPTRATDFGHMREGWVRSINNRTRPKPGTTALAENEKMGLDESVNNFKAIFGGGRKGVGKGKVLMMRRGAEGELGVWVEDDNPDLTTNKEKQGTKTGQMSYLGGLQDERISRLVWLGYLAGQNVASEGARKNVVEGVMEIVGRPIGTIDTQVI
ncbi:MAG: hypothetical protein L6R42_008391 [Xanthoria sp. 1 TBL-2021]|nr:MAG: hypothetical protein L6R42_008391 [Xanthoria sp. 1 TBL-2021]